MNDLISTCEKKGFECFGTIRKNERWMKNSNTKIRLTDFEGRYSAEIRREKNSPESFASKDKQETIDYLNIEL